MAAAPENHNQKFDEALSQYESARSTLEILAAARQVRRCAQELELDAVQHARSEGISWGKIGGVYGLTKQGAQQRFKPPLHARTVAEETDGATKNDGATTN